MGSSSRSRSRSGSRSRSRSPIRLDRFGRVMPKDRDRSRSPRHSYPRDRRRSPIPVRRYRSRSRSPRRRYYRSSSHRSSRSYRRSRSRSRGESRSRSSRSRSHSRQKERSPGIHGSTNIQDLELMKARVFIGNLPFDKVTKEELENMFEKYGKILGMLSVSKFCISQLPSAMLKQNLDLNFLKHITYEFLICSF